MTQSPDTYSLSLQEFLLLEKGKLAECLAEKLGTEWSDREYASWEGTQQHVQKLLNCSGISKQATLSFEYRVPLTQLRIDMLVIGHDKAGHEQVVAIELKEWSDNYKGKDNPCYQVQGYADLLLGYNEYISNNGVGITRVVYFPNRADVSQWTGHETVDVFGMNDEAALRALLAKKISRADAEGKLYRKILNSEIRPMPHLVDIFDKAVSRFFPLSGEQRAAMDAIIKAADTKGQSKKLIVVSGAPGTGKSVVAINVLAKLLGKNVCYSNPAKEMPLQWVLYHSLKQRASRPIFRNAQQILEEEKHYDIILLDEAHKLNYGPDNSSQLCRLLKLCNVLVLFGDNSQTSQKYDIYDQRYYVSTARLEYPDIESREICLETQFRCGGSQTYIDWVRNLLDNRIESNHLLKKSDYAFVVCDRPSDVVKEISRKQTNQHARMLMANSWTAYKDGKSIFKDTEFAPVFKNRNTHSDVWATDDAHKQEIGSIFDCAGLEFDYVGIFMLQDLKSCPEGIKCVPCNNLSYRRSVYPSGDYDYYFDLSVEQAEKFIKNVYYIMLTRGTKGCYVYIHDPQLREYVRKHLSE